MIPPLGLLTAYLHLVRCPLNQGLAESNSENQAAVTEPASFDPTVDLAIFQGLVIYQQRAKLAVSPWKCTPASK